jgi:hypothetical protein
MFSDMNQILGFMASKASFSFWVVQKYIERPLLYKGRKFDIRCWVVFTDRCEVFFYIPGYLRTSSDEYTLDSKNN